MKREKRTGNKMSKYISDYIRDALDYIKESKNYIYITIAIFIASILIGFFNASYLSVIDKFLRDLIEKTAGLEGIELIAFILVNNIGSAFLGLFFGIAFGVFSVINTLVNGIVLGYVLARAYDFSGFSDFWRILPHGIFELPAVFISLGLGLKLGLFMFSKNIGKELKRRFFGSSKAFIFVVIPLLIIAAIIEGLLITFLG